DKTIDDITNFIKLKKQKRNNKNILHFLMGNSMSSVLALYYAAKGELNNEFSGYIALTPALEEKKISKIIIGLDFIKEIKEFQDDKIIYKPIMLAKAIEFLYQARMVLEKYYTEIDLTVLLMYGKGNKIQSTNAIEKFYDKLQKINKK
ncbi:24183_t:CDS:2, partial [Racocetra persica]